MKKGVCIIDAETFHPVYGKLCAGDIVDLPDDFDFKRSKIFEEYKEPKPNKADFAIERRNIDKEG